MTTPRLVFTLKGSSRYVRVSTLTEMSTLQFPPETEALSLEGAPVDDDALVKLPTLAHLRCLDLDGTNVTDKSMGWVASLPKLEELWLECTSITDVGLRELEHCRMLRYVSVAYTEVTAPGLAALRRATPNLELSGP